MFAERKLSSLAWAQTLRTPSPPPGVPTSELWRLSISVMTGNVIPPLRTASVNSALDVMAKLGTKGLPWASASRIAVVAVRSGT